MDIFFYLIALGIIIATFMSKKVNHLDIMPILLFYFDATYVFLANPINYIYFSYVLILFLSLNYFFNENNKQSVKNFGVFFYLGFVLLGIQLINGESLDRTLRLFSYSYSSLVILPWSFSYYSKKGNMDKLLFSTYLLVVIYVAYVLFATTQKLGGIQSERVGGYVFYFGYIAMRGGITYISFVLLMVPLLIIKIKKKWQIYTSMFASGFIILIFLFVMKRFVFLVIGLGLMNYVFHPETKKQTKKYLVIFIAVLIGIYLFSPEIQVSIEERIQERGGEKKFGIDRYINDLRIYEILYVFDNVKHSAKRLLVGDKRRPLIDVKIGNINIIDRDIHNTYAGVLFKYGFIGLGMYLFIYYSLYRFTKYIYQALKKYSNEYFKYWITFQNLILLFLLQGMVGGQSHVTLRGLVFLYTGAIGGVLYHSFVISESEMQSRL